MNENILSIVREYKRKKRRDKARAFLEYASDVKIKTVESVRFYAECWAVSHTTSAVWIQEFKSLLKEYNEL
jgi:mannose-6-phosphate isomerase class I